MGTNTTKLMLKKAEKLEWQQEKIKNFSDLLDTLNLEDKKKFLWLDVYENAVSDRIKAEILYADVLPLIKTDSQQHILMGNIVSKYLERMEKSNNQILKLAELVQQAQKESDEINPSDIYEALERQE